MNTTMSTETGAEEISWNLADLHETLDELHTSLGSAAAQAQGFRDRFRGQVHSLEPGALAQTLKEFEQIHDVLDRAYTYAYLNWCSNTEEAEHGALLQSVREKYLACQQEILFFELELIQRAPEFEAGLIAHPQLQPFRHYLEVLLDRQPHVLTEPEEKIMAEKSVTGYEAWGRFFDELIAAARFPFQGEELTEQQVLAKLYESDRRIRKQAAAALTAGLKPRLRQLTYVFNTVLADKASQDRLRNFPHWLASRNLANEIRDEAVQVLVKSVVNRFDLVARFYYLKRRLLGYDELFDYDRYAPLELSSRRYLWPQAREIVLDSYQQFHPRMADIAEQFFEHRWIDAALRPGKRGGAFSHRAVPQVHPYILMNYSGSVRDIQTLAHELGHGVHQYLSNAQGSLQANPPLTTSETASTFGELLVFDRLMEQQSTPEEQLALLISKIDDSTATVFRQVAMNQFEERIHTTRREDGELSAEQFSEHWITTQQEMFQDSVTLSHDYRMWWSYIPHFVHAPGYVYAYAFGELLVLALYSIYRSQGGDFAEQYLELLKAGGSDWPHLLIGRLGVDLQDPHFWREGLGEVERLIVQAEDLAEKCGQPAA